MLPLAFAAYLPVAWVLDKPTPPGIPSALVWATPLVAVAALLVSRAGWQAGLRTYRSTGT